MCKLKDSGIVDTIIRSYRPDDEAAVVDFALRAWEPVFFSMRDLMGPAIFQLLHGDDWSEYQKAAIKRVLADDGMHTWVAEVGGQVAGFVAVHIADDRSLGEIYMIAVAPEHQNLGLGTTLTNFATEWMREAGLPLALIGTGGDIGHAPARRTYEKSGYTAMPIVNYYKAL